MAASLTVRLSVPLIMVPRISRLPRVPARRLVRQLLLLEETSFFQIPSPSHELLVLPTFLPGLFF